MKTVRNPKAQSEFKLVRNAKDNKTGQTFKAGYQRKEQDCCLGYRG